MAIYLYVLVLIEFVNYIEPPYCLGGSIPILIGVGLVAISNLIGALVMVLYRNGYIEPSTCK